VPGLNTAKRLCKRCARWLHAALLARQDAGREAAQKRLAEKRSLSLLLNLLNDEQRFEFQSHGFFHVTGGRSGDRYRIRCDSAVNIDVLGKDGAVRIYLCGRPTGNLPMYDVMAAQLLYLQDRGSETRFLGQANRHATMSFPGMMVLRNSEQRS
jgi:hypothetical protein